MTQELRKLAEAVGENTRSRFEVDESGWSLVGDDYEAQAYIAAANPAAILALLDRVEKAEKDAGRLDWVQTKLFTQRWNGVVGQGCLTQWSIAPDYRHSLTTMQTSDIEIDFRGAIDSAMEASK